MFWGNGDSSKLSPEERETLDQLRRLVESGHIVALSSEQTKVALAAINFYGTITATTGFLVGVRNTLYWIAGLAGVWWVSKDTLVAFIQQIASAGKP